MAELHSENLMYEILLRMPVMSLLRFRCVCKGWRDLIDTRNFAKSHLHTLCNRPPSLLVIRHDSCNKAYNVADLGSVFNGGSPLIYRELPFPAEGESVYYVGQCNGLVCMSSRAGVVLWNPATRKHFLWEPPPEEKCFMWGFGYDKDSDDYKVAAMPTTGYSSPPMWICSLRSRSWKCIGRFPYFLMGYRQLGAFVNGALHWKVCQWETNYVSVGSLHLGKLECTMLDMPEDTVKGFEYLGELDGKLCVVYYGSDYDDFDMWTMKEYGVKESWTKLIRCLSYTRVLISLAYLQNDEVLLFTSYFDETCECEFMSFGRRYEIKMRSFGRLLGGYCPYVYVPSLVCPQNDL